jgi:hypothetical protein
MKKKTKDVPRWSGWTLPDGTEVPAVPCGSVFKGKKEKLRSQQSKELDKLRKEYL